jgi:hypothetical protein
MECITLPAYHSQAIENIGDLQVLPNELLVKIMHQTGNLEAGHTGQALHACMLTSPDHQGPLTFQERLLLLQICHDDENYTQRFRPPDQASKIVMEITKTTDTLDPRFEFWYAFMELIQFLQDDNSLYLLTDSEYFPTFIQNEYWSFPTFYEFSHHFLPPEVIRTVWTLIPDPFIIISFLRSDNNRIRLCNMEFQFIPGKGLDRDMTELGASLYVPPLRKKPIMYGRHYINYNSNDVCKYGTLTHAMKFYELSLTSDSCKILNIYIWHRTLCPMPEFESITMHTHKVKNLIFEALHDSGSDSD